MGPAQLGRGRVTWPPEGVGTGPGGRPVGGAPPLWGDHPALRPVWRRLSGAVLPAFALPAPTYLPLRTPTYSTGTSPVTSF